MNLPRDLFTLRGRHGAPRVNLLSAPDLRHWLALIRARGLGPASISRLLEAYGEPGAAFHAAPAALRALGLDAEQIAALATPDWAGVDRDLAWLEQPGRRLLTCTDPDYPAALREIPQPPPALFCQGDASLLRRPQLAIVGARTATPQGLENARAFGAELARRGLVITSGLALGIDGAAHQGALQADGLSIAVCATGLDRVYPARHRDLAHQLARQGLLVSEFPVGVQALQENFPRRNRIISGLALGVLVVEAALESGSLITARYAVEQGREVFAIPGSIHNPLSRGAHALIRQGAKLVESVDDILEEIAPQLADWGDDGAGLALDEAADPGSSDDDAPAPSRGRARLLLASLGGETLDFDELARRSGLPSPDLAQLLLQLEMDGRVAALPGGRYQALHVL